MSNTTIINTQNAAQWVSSLLNGDISALQTTETARCREYIWELQHAHRSSNSSHRNPSGRSTESLLYCIERLFHCLSDEAQKTLIQQTQQSPLDNRPFKGVE